MIFTLVSQGLFAKEKLVCKEQAELAIAKEWEQSLEEFRFNNDFLWSEVRVEKGNTLEEIQFGDGSGLVGIMMKRGKKTCAQVGEIYTGQDDQD